MTPYEIQPGNDHQQAAVETRLAGLDLVSSAVRRQIITAWVSSWTSSSYATLDDVPYSTLAPDLPLMRHVAEVTRTGIVLARQAMEEWGDKIDWDVMIPILTLHDVDKPLMFKRENNAVSYSDLARELPHGVVGGMLVKELGFPHVVVSTVTTHASNAPFHGRNLEAYILHYADFFATDRACMRSGAPPFYQRHLK